MCRPCNDEDPVALKPPSFIGADGKKLSTRTNNRSSSELTLFYNYKSPFMSFVLKFKPSGFTAAKYDEVVKQLDAAGAGAPKGRSYHVCFGDPNNVQVTDVWDNMEDFQAFGKTLLPIMESLGTDPGQPEIEEVHNIIIGELHSLA